MRKSKVEMTEQHPSFSNALAEFDTTSSNWTWPVPVLGSLRDRYDHVLYEPEVFQAKAARVMDTQDSGSDHFAVWTELMVQPAMQERLREQEWPGLTTRPETMGSQS